MGTDDGTRLDIHLDIASDMTILRTTVNRTVDDATRDLHLYTACIGVVIEVRAVVTLSCAKEVAGYGVRDNLFQGARHTNRTASHLHDRFTLDVGNLIAAIDVCQDMATGDAHLGIAFYPTGRTNPFVARSILEGQITGAATEHTSNPRLTVGRIRSAGRTQIMIISIGFIIIVIRVIGQINPVGVFTRTNIPSVWVV